MTQARLLGGRYQVGELLGYGGMAEVHRGRDLRLGRDVAIKMLRTDLARDDTFQLRFRREAQNAASLNHPAIVAVYDTGEELSATGETLPYIVMEFVNGRTLKEVLAAEGRLMPRRALEITAEICSALEFSHRHSIIHRDIKPGNVMLTQTGQVKVMDFGIARALASGASTMTQTSAVIGTAQYLSPEQARGEAVDARSDVYATGCVLYELLCGHPPFVGDSPVSVAYQHVREDPKPPSFSNRDVPAPVDAIALKSLAKNPMNRYQSAAEMRADLLRAAAGRPVYAEPVLPASEVTGATATIGRTGPPTRGRLDSRRKRPNAWLVATLVGLAVLAVVALTAVLIIASQPKRVAVPDLAGLNRTQADTVLRDRSLVPDPQIRSSVDCTVGDVLDQTPTAGTQLTVNSKVTYVYCAGPGKTQVPPVVGLTQEAAAQALTDRNLKPEIKPVDSDRPAGTVVNVSPTSGTEVNEGDTVTLEVSKGNRIQVPDVTGSSEEAAREVLRRAGFTNVVTVTVSVNSPDKDGKVDRQDPDPDTLLDPAAKVTLFVGDYEEPPVTESATPSPPPPPGPGS